MHAVFIVVVTLIELLVTLLFSKAMQNGFSASQ